MERFKGTKGKRERVVKEKTDFYNRTNEIHFSNDGDTNCLTSVQKDNLIAYGCDYRKDEGFRVRKNEKSSTLMARAREDVYGTGLVKTQLNIRRSTPTECELLQTVPINYTDCVSDRQRHRMLGNGWTISVISHMLSYMTLTK